LKKHGFTQSVQLHEDPEQQDKLTTWIEFLNYEYRRYDSCIDTINRLQPQFDKAWKTLVDSKVLRPLETPEFLWDLMSATQRQDERHKAEEIVDNAILAVKAAEKTFQEAQCARLSGQSFFQIEEKLCAARSQLAATKTSLEQIKSRRYLISDFKEQTARHRYVKQGADRHKILL
jgi:hypothetical protein